MCVQGYKASRSCPGLTPPTHQGERKKRGVGKNRRGLGLEGKSRKKSGEEAREFG